jgi:hypothetical protein
MRFNEHSFELLRIVICNFVHGLMNSWPRLKSLNILSLCNVHTKTQFQQLTLILNDHEKLPMNKDIEK